MNPSFSPQHSAAILSEILAQMRDLVDGSAELGLLGATLPASQGRVVSLNLPPNVNNAHGWYQSMLRAGLAVRHPSAVKGGMVWEPRGVAMLASYHNLVTDAYKRFGLQEYDFPLLYSERCFAPLDELFPLANKLLRVHAKAGSAAIGALNSSGESPIYGYFSGKVFPPTGMFRRARYYRPPHGGDALLRPAEACDVYEAYQFVAPTTAAIVGAMRSNKEMLDSIFAAIGIRPIWSIRPIWTNNAIMNDLILSADAVLPDRRLVQLGAIYLQKDELTNRYKMHRAADSSIEHGRMVVGYCSRRALTVAVAYAAMQPRGLTLPSAIAPIQVGFVGSPPLGEQIELLGNALEQLGLRCEFVTNAESGRTRSCLERFASQGIPISAVLRESKEQPGLLRASLVENDTLCEFRLEPACGDVVAREVFKALSRVDQRLTARVEGLVSSSFSAMHEATSSGAIVTPLAYDHGAVQHLERSVVGEVIGFLRSGRSQPCVVSGAPTAFVAYAAPRV
ncbi:MAG: hypothetical protein K1X83_14400 [Oligoflexia bacterium]|nr:hypothetical protein [Oligoflexia bacterium]